MNIVKLESFSVIGIKVRTTNENAQAAKDIVALWNTFMSEHILDKTPNKISTEVFSIYTNYEGDYTKPYDTILGCKVSSIDEVPNGMVAHTIKASTYKKSIAKGDLSKNVVYNKWLEIWEAKEDRLYTSDFEIYGDTAKDTTNAEVPIYVAVKE
ncbi:GyrI-like domain-containing protein [Cellulophaga fucicola]|uniref:Predicted transcriptional regulator YdeE, contains AraC-type DNA-binding domain n=1 Tax=Cellulophaga fucicola TaxID=76595 RepID=A0A1K1P2D6_9FLAO|nr:GyrI-like domain-containing protein [Cellulophaga fucicola]SFW40830.1 Predicted transcriptional regulator YdeE, contains AraC-type DNA-binding domain [Cellulophaga fucicola]